MSWWHNPDGTPAKPFRGRFDPSHGIILIPIGVAIVYTVGESILGNTTRDKIVSMIVAGIFPVFAAWMMSMLGVWYMRLSHVNERLHERHAAIAKERARLRVAVRDVCEWFNELPVDEKYVIGYLAFDDLRKELVGCRVAEPPK